MSTRTDRNQCWDLDGNLVEDDQVVVDTTAEDNESTIRQQVDLALTMLQQIIDTPQVTFSNVAGAQTAMRALQAQVKDEARVLRRLIRLAVQRFDGSD